VIDIRNAADWANLPFDVVAAIERDNVLAYESLWRRINRRDPAIVRETE
jgi:hypothetical protein